MNQAETYQKMLEGFRVRTQYYLPEEYAFINDGSKIQTEDGCIMGSRFNEFWAIYQSNQAMSGQ